MQRIDILWRDIPSQVLIKRGRDRGKYMLSARFQEAIDRAAMRAGKGGSDAYLDEWRRVTTAIEAEGALADIAAQLGQEIEAQYSDEDITRLAKQNGYAESNSLTRPDWGPCAGAMARRIVRNNKTAPPPSFLFSSFITISALGYPHDNNDNQFGH